MNGIGFGQPWVLVLLPVAPLAFALWELGTRRAASRARAISRAAPPRSGRLSAGILALATVLGVFAAAAPRWGAEQSELRRQGADLVIVFDVSRSMAATDVPPSRLAAAREAAAETLRLLAGDRAGLVVFGGSARLRFPLTTDLNAAVQVIRSLEAGPVFVDGGTDAASGLDLALSAFPPGETRGRIVLLLTDGENLGPDPAGAAARLRAAGVELLVAGVGTTAGGKVPVFDVNTRSFTDKIGEDGEPLVSRLNEPFLRALAAATGGRYLGSEPGAVPGIVAGRVASLKQEEIGARVGEIPIERYQWFAGAALALLVLATIAERLPAGLRGRSRTGVLAPAVIAIALALLPGCASHAYVLNGSALDAYEAGEYDRAIDQFYEALAAEPADPRLALNLAAALDRAGRFEEAVEAARRALLSPNDKERARAYASIGHHQFNAGDLDAALEAFKQALLIDPGDADARHDYEVVLRILGPKAHQDGESQPGSPGEGKEGSNGSEPQPGDGGSPGGDQPGAGQPGGGGGSEPGTDPAAVGRRLAEIDREVESILAETGGEVTPSNAMRILELLAERSRVAAQRGAFAGSSDPNDY